MHPSVLDAWHRFSEPMEGRVHSMYVDVLGLVTCGVGNLIDPVGEALKLPWRARDGSLATATQVHQEWNAVKAAADTLRKRHYRYAADYSTVRLTDEDIDALVHRKLLSNEHELKNIFVGWDWFPADAQLGISSMAWAMGSGFPHKFPSFTRHVQQGHWDDAAMTCKIRAVGNPGVIPRNKANAICFHNAAAVLSLGLLVEDLHWPSELNLAEEKPGEPAPMRSMTPVSGTPISLPPADLIPLEPDWTAIRDAREKELQGDDDDS